MTGKRFQFPTGQDAVDPAFLELLALLDRETGRLDSQFVIPWTNIHFGWDPIIGLVPVAGDLIAAAYSVRLIGLARRLGADNALLSRMVLNVAVDVGLGSIPVAGPVLDLFFRANSMNLKLLLDAIERRRGPRHEAD